LLKTVLYYLLILITALRLADIVFLLTAGGTNLPLAVIVSSCLMLAYAAILISKRIFGGNVTLRQYIAYYVIHALVTLFNLFYTSAATPLPVSLLEAFAIGTFFDVLIDTGAVYFSRKQIRSTYLAVAPSPQGHR
jgi:predicted neutral ceramidase superfamily lipid hydrolase